MSVLPQATAFPIDYSKTVLDVPAKPSVSTGLKSAITLPARYKQQRFKERSAA